MKYFSEKTNKLYSTLEALNHAEEEVAEKEKQEKIKAEREKAEKDKLAAERKARAAEVEEARKKMVEAQKAYRDKLEAFVADYKSYHYTSTSIDDIPTLFNFFNLF